MFLLFVCCCTTDYSTFFDAAQPDRKKPDKASAGFPAEAFICYGSVSVQGLVLVLFVQLQQEPGQVGMLQKIVQEDAL